MDGVWALAVAALAVKAWRMRRQTRMQAAERWRERRIREELEAYARLDPSLTRALNAAVDPLEAARLLARRVCRTIAEHSAFTRVAMLLRDREGRLVCVGSVAVDDLTLSAIQAWAEGVVAEERSERRLTAATVPGSPMGARSFSIPLGEWSAFDSELASWARSGRKERRRWRRGIVVPIRIGSQAGNNAFGGAIVVCADGERLDGAGADGWAAWAGPQGSRGLARAIGPIETLAERLSAALENEALTARLLKTEKLAGLGQLAGGVAHALNNPLTAVLGFAELIAETSNDPRVRQDAGTILAEARRMTETVQRLVDFWRPGPVANEAVDVAGILRELAQACGDRLRRRGVGLVLTIVAAPLPSPVRGSKDRLRQVFEHLLNNAAQAIATARPREEGEEHAIRLTVSHDTHTMHVIVSDTGPGFREPGRVFDPFYTTRAPEQGAGLGLSICYGIVREHGGEISAFNLHPHGAAVVVELPLQVIVTESAVVMPEREPGVLSHGLTDRLEVRRPVITQDT
jgi:signal transduction histidine kinase